MNKRARPHFILLVIPLIFVTIFSITVCFLLPQKHSKTRTKLTLYPTSMRLSKIEWIEEHLLIAAQGNTLVTFDTQTRHRKILCSFEHPIGNFSIREKKDIFVFTTIGTKIDLYVCTMSGSIQPVHSFTLDPNTTALLGQDHLCLTTIRTIVNPIDIATTIETVSLDDLSKRTIFSSSLTIEPLSCSFPLILAQPYPLEKRLYSWESNQKSPTSISDEKLYVFESVHFQNGTLGIQTPHSVVLRSNPFIENSTLDVVMTDDSIWGIVNTSAIAIVDTRTRQLTIVTESDRSSFSIFIPDIAFTSLYPQKYGSSFALLTSEGNLWIAELSQSSLD